MRFQRAEVYAWKKMSTSWGENGWVVEWLGSVGIFVITDGCAVNEQGVGESNQRINYEILAAHWQISPEKMGGFLLDSDCLLNRTANNITLPL